MSRLDTLEARRTTMSSPDRRSDQAVAATELGGSALVAIGGLCVGGLAIAGLANAVPLMLAAIGTLVFGIVMILQGTSLAARHVGFLSETGGVPAISEMAGMGVTRELAGIGGLIAGGIAGLVLGILALIGVVPFILMAVSTIVFGVCLWLNSAATSRVSTGELGNAGSRGRGCLFMRQAVWMTIGINALIGLAAIVLGILSVVAAADFAFIPSLVLTLVALLCLGCAALVSGLVVSSKVTTYLSRW